MEWAVYAECFMANLRRFVISCEKAVVTKTQLVSTSQIQG